jgi:hypothetical protein
VGFPAFNMGHKSDAAVVVFKFGTIKSLIRWSSPGLFLTFRELVNLIRHGRNSVGLCRRFFTSDYQNNKKQQLLLGNSKFMNLLAGNLFRS